MYRNQTDKILIHFHLIETKELLKVEPEIVEGHGTEGLDNVDDGIEHVEMQNLLEVQMKCFLCDDRISSFMEMEDHLSEEHQIDREAYQAFVKWCSNKTTAKEGKNEVK